MKLSSWTIYIIGIAIAIIALSFGYFHQFMPNSAEARSFNERADELEAEANKLGRAKDRVKRAEEMVNAEAAKWRSIVATRTPRTNVNDGGINLGVNGWQLTVDSQKFANNIQRAVNKQLLAGGVRVTQAPFVPRPNVAESGNALLTSYYNLSTYGFPVVIFNLGTVTVEGTYDQIKENFRAWRSMPRYLAVADGLSLTGTGNQLTGTYQVSVVGFIRGTDIFPAVPEGAPAAGGAAGGGFAPSAPGGAGFGGPPGGFGGPPPGVGPPGGFGGPPNRTGAGGPPTPTGFGAAGGGR